MEISNDRILTTYGGSLPRPQDVVDLLFAQGQGEPSDDAQFDKAVRNAVNEAVRPQVEAGIDIFRGLRIGISAVLLGEAEGAQRARLASARL
jgi:methionine synthase II (cobalamin-independent)